MVKLSGIHVKHQCHLGSTKWSAAEQSARGPVQIPILRVPALLLPKAKVHSLMPQIRELRAVLSPSEHDFGVMLGKVLSPS